MKTLLLPMLGLLLAVSPQAGAAVGPIAAFSYVTLQTLPAMIKEASRHRSLRQVPVYIGGYTINLEAERLVHRLPRGRYAPLLKWAPTNYPARRLSAADRAKLPPSARAFNGRIPSNLTMRGGREQFLWGLETGRRARDMIRNAKRKGIKVDRWQYDEIVSEVYQQNSRAVALRRFQAGTLRGLSLGRPELGDRRLLGLVCVAHPERLAALAGTSDVHLLLAEMDRASLRLLGEEYPEFVGDPRAAARRYSRTQAVLKAAGGARRRLAAKYVPTFTPGYRVRTPEGGPTGLNGNVQHRPDAWVDQWRKSFIDERLKTAPAGVGEYHFVFENSRRHVVNATLAAVARGLRALSD